MTALRRMRSMVRHESVITALIVAAILRARRAARLDPLRALQYE